MQRVSFECFAAAATKAPPKLVLFGAREFDFYRLGGLRPVQMALIIAVTKARTYFGRPQPGRVRGKVGEHFPDFGGQSGGITRWKVAVPTIRLASPGASESIVCWFIFASIKGKLGIEWKGIAFAGNDRERYRHLLIWLLLSIGGDDIEPTW